MFTFYFSVAYTTWRHRNYQFHLLISKYIITCIQVFASSIFANVTRIKHMHSKASLWPPFQIKHNHSVECRKDKKKVFKLSKSFMGSNSNINLPYFTSAELLADRFNNCFMNKTIINKNKIISDFPKYTFSFYVDTVIMFIGKMLVVFRPTSEVEIRKIIIKSPNKSCDLDPLPTWLLKKCLDQLLPMITTVINWSMDESALSLCLKRATITPLLKRSALYTETM